MTKKAAFTPPPPHPRWRCSAVASTAQRNFSPLIPPPIFCRLPEEKKGVGRLHDPLRHRRVGAFEAPNRHQSHSDHTLLPLPPRLPQLSLPNYRPLSHPLYVIFIPGGTFPPPATSASAASSGPGGADRDFGR